MGYSNWSDVDYRRVSRTRSTSSSREIFRGEHSIDPLMDPRKLTMREARDSEHHPNSVPIVVAFDVTASMGDIPTRFAKDLLGTLMAQLVEERRVTDPQVLFAAIGDAVSDRAPLQVGQFESGLEMDTWLTRLWLEGAGGDVPESYTLAHWFAAHHTATDAWEKRGRKGYLFTIGDAPHKPLKDSHVERVFGRPPEHPTDSASVIRAAGERYELFHILVTRGRTAARTLSHWTTLVGDRVLVLHEIDAICEVMAVTMGVCEGTVDADQARAKLGAAGVDEATIDRVVRSAR